MTTNRLAVRSVGTDYPKTPQGWADRGNAHLAQIGRAHELQWVVRNGRPAIEWKLERNPNVASL